MLAAKLTNEIEGEDEEMPVDDTMDAEMDMDAEMGAEAGAGSDVGNLSIDVDQDGEFDEFDIYFCIQLFPKWRNFISSS